MTGKDPGGIIISILLGIAGSFLFNYSDKFIGLYQEGETTGFTGALIGADIPLALCRLFKKKAAKYPAEYKIPAKFAGIFNFPIRE